MKNYTRKWGFLFQQMKKKNGQKTNRKRTFKKMNCSPETKNKTPLDHTCFTKNALEILKKSYNKRNHDSPEKQITENDPAKIWEQMQEKIPECEKETCWLNQIPDDSLKMKMKEHFFAPFQPSEWKQNPVAWLSNYDILDVLEQYEKAHSTFLFLGPTPIDFDDPISNVFSNKKKCVWEELCQLSIQKEYNKGKRQIGIIFNLDKHDEPGSHWVSMYINLENNPHPFIFYFDSTSAKIPDKITTLKNRIQKQWLEMPENKGHRKLNFYQNLNTNHQKQNTECGMYSLFFLITMLTRELNLPDKLDKPKKLSFSELLKLFLGPKRITDKQMQQFREIYYNKND